MCRFLQKGEPASPPTHTCVMASACMNSLCEFCEFTSSYFLVSQGGICLFVDL